MRNNILREDLDAVIEHLKQDDPILTHGANVRAFEAEWSEWLGVKYSVFVNSGASANLLTMAILKIRHPEGGEVITPPLAWVSDIASVLQNGFIPVFADIDPSTLSMDSTQILSKITDKKVILIAEDVDMPKGLGFDEVQAFLPVLVGFAGKPNDNVRADSDVGAGCANPCDEFRKLGSLATPRHAPQNRIGTALQGQVQMRHEPGVSQQADKSLR